MGKKKSTAKRQRQSEKARARNRSIRSETRALAKKVTRALLEGNVEAAKRELPAVVRALDKAVTKGVLHRKTASRKISRLTRAVNAKATS